MFAKGFQKDLEDDDLYEVVKPCKSKKCSDKLEKALKAEDTKENFSIWKLLWKVYGWRYIGLGILHLTWTIVVE